MEFFIELLAEILGSVIVEFFRHITIPKWLHWSIITIFILGAIALLILGIYRLGWVLLQAFLLIIGLALLVLIGYLIYRTCHYGILRQARNEDLSRIMQLYRSVIGHPGCNWSISYPNEANLYEDFHSQNLYVLCKGKKIIGAGSIVPQNELDDLSCWRYQENTREIARIVIAPAYQGKGHGKYMVRKLCSRMRSAGIQAVHLLVSTENYHAIRLYRNAGFFGRAQCKRYGNMYYALEKKLYK